MNKIHDFKGIHAWRRKFSDLILPGEMEPAAEHGSWHTLPASGVASVFGGYQNGGRKSSQPICIPFQIQKALFTNQSVHFFIDFLT